MIAASKSSGHSGEHRIDLAVDPATALDEIAEVAEIWGADFTRDGLGGVLLLPVTAGVRHGVVHGRISVEPDRDGCAVHFAVEEEQYRVRLGVVVVLLLGALGGLSMTLWPFYPPLLQLVPVGLILSTVAWLLVVSRLRSTGPNDFLALVAAEPEGPSPTIPEVESPPEALRPR